MCVCAPLRRLAPAPDQPWNGITETRRLDLSWRLLAVSDGSQPAVVLRFPRRRPPRRRPPGSGNGASFNCLESCTHRQPSAPGLGRQPAATIAMRRGNRRYGMQKAACDRRDALTASRNVPHRKRPGVCCRLAIAGRPPRATAQYTISNFRDGANSGTQEVGKRREGIAPRVAAFCAATPQNAARDSTSRTSSACREMPSFRYICFRCL